MHYTPTTALSAVLGFLSLASALPTAEPSTAELTTRAFSPITFTPNPDDPTYCQFGMQFDPSSNNVGLTLWDHNGVSLGYQVSTGGTNHFNFDSQLPYVFVVNVPKMYSNADVKDGTTMVQWGYGKHKGTYGGADYVSCDGTQETCWISFDCSS